MVFLCGSCGNDFPKWYGQCPLCGEWGTLQEHRVGKSKHRERSGDSKPSTILSDLLVQKGIERITTSIDEFNRVVGGGIYPGSILLLGGNPGIGKSTLAIQLISSISRRVFYVSAEENEEQITLRAKRLGIASKDLYLTSENCIENIEEQVSSVKPMIFIIDSIQTIFSEKADGLPGSIIQVRECGQKILTLCKEKNIIGIIIGHVTKEGVLAGPKMLEHMVDTVLYLEGDRRQDFRILRATKNRFGPTNEVGVFEMTVKGLSEVKNPSELFLSERRRGVAGSAVVAIMEGTRSMLIEVQALVSTATFGTPQRNVTGFDIRRLSMLIAVLEKRLGYSVGTKDVFVNVVGGISIDEPSADLAVAVALVSSLKNKPVSEDSVFVGEVGLGGELRGASFIERRANESKQLGFKKLFAPKSSVKKVSGLKGFSMIGEEDVKQVLDVIF